MPRDEGTYFYIHDALDGTLMYICVDDMFTCRHCIYYDEMVFFVIFYIIDMMVYIV